MTDDLKARLRSMHSHRSDGLPTQHVNPDGPEAADRIEALEARIEALRFAHEAIINNWVSNRTDEGDEFSEGFDDGLHDASKVSKDAIDQDDAASEEYRRITDGTALAGGGDE